LRDPFINEGRQGKGLTVCSPQLTSLVIEGQSCQQVLTIGGGFGLEDVSATRYRAKTLRTISVRRLFAIFA
jgi:hypothetical protein